MSAGRSLASSIARASDISRAVSLASWSSAGVASVSRDPARR